MSIRAYYVQYIKTKDSPTFNLWFETKVVEWLKHNTSFFESLNGDLCGLASVYVSDLKRMLRELGEQIHPDTRKAIEEDIELSQKDYITYYCL